MEQLSTGDFPAFFEKAYGYAPFQWQGKLLEMVASGDWPELIDLPTASGKTACIDIAVFALALQADQSALERTARRRIFFVVDRRIVVDEAFERARKLAEKLACAADGVLKVVADRLRRISGGCTPLAVARLRGGIGRLRQPWSEDPLQVAIITGTVDQVGSRLLFRSYGGSPLVAPVHAALVAYDSLVILDEAHCAQPFMQTVEGVQGYLDARKWSLGKINIAPPLRLVVMSATAPKQNSSGRNLSVFPAPGERESILSDQKIVDRTSAVKLARLEAITAGGTSALGKRAADLAREQVGKGRRRVAVMVNRVILAHEIADKLNAAGGAKNLAYDVVLLTGRMRPIDRDGLVERWSPFLRAAEPENPVNPIIVVTTQCLEVGADFGFDALITQCAAVDALLQRFGRLARLGHPRQTEAFILADKAAASPGAEDPIYGAGLANTWAWLTERAKDSPEPGTVDFAVNAIGSQIHQMQPGNLKKLLAAQVPAPVLMPAHVDILCQTAPQPEPDIDVPAYLHGIGRGEPEVRVAFRVDLTGANDALGTDRDSAAAYRELLRYCPLQKLECLSVPISRLRRYLLEADASRAEIGGEDVEGVGLVGEEKNESGNAGPRFFLRHRGGDWAPVQAAPSRDLLCPGDMVVLPVQPDGSIPAALGTGLKGSPIDRAEEAAWAAHPPGQRGGIFLRLSGSVLRQAGYKDASDSLLQWLEQNARRPEDEGPDLEQLRVALKAAASSTVSRDLRGCIQGAAVAVKARHLRPHPVDTAGWVICIPGGLADFDGADRGEDATSDSQADVQLTDHLERVGLEAEKFAPALSSEAVGLLEAIKQAARWHDLGKLDPRFQDMLGNIGDQPWAKSNDRSNRSVDFRHEMVSLQIVEHCLTERLPADAVSRELLLHLIASHHGYGRAFAPYRDDAEPVDIVADVLGVSVNLPAELRGKRPAHHVGSGIPDRFWYLTRHFGWWGLAYLEALVRLADWRASAEPANCDPNNEEAK